MRLASIIWIVLLTGCSTVDIGGPTVPVRNPEAGILTLPGGRSVGVLPDDLAYTGEASYRWPDGRTYEGVLQLGKPQGIGTEVLPNGERYSGQWHEGVRQGHGELYRADRSRYVGEFTAGVRQGQGTERSSEGLYRGRWLKDLPNGQGEFHGNDGAAYSGGWVDGYREGFGVFVDAKSNRYEGDWYNDRPSGFGTMTGADGTLYEGRWSDSTRSGYGRMISAAGLRYEGTWSDGQRDGYGVAERPDGTRYEGEWANGNRQGQGRETWSDGSYHDGTWENNQPLGPGTRRDRTGIEISGIWNADHVSSGLIRLPTGPEYAGVLLRRGNSEVDASLVDWFDTQAARNDPYANFFLGTVYTDYRNPPPDRARAESYFLAAADAGIAEAQFRLAVLVVGESPSRAIELLVGAAAADHAQANALLGEYYLTGQWVPVDYQMARRYLDRAIDAGDISARNNLAWLLATHSDGAIRDGERSVALIAPIAEMFDNWEHLDTLAAAQAEIGDFEHAVETQAQAIELARLSATADPTRETNLPAMEQRLELYQQGKPYRMP